MMPRVWSIIGEAGTWRLRKNVQSLWAQDRLPGEECVNLKAKDGWEKERGQFF